MRNIVVISIMLVIALAPVGCQQREKQQPVSYTGAPLQTPLPTQQVEQMQEAVKAAPKNPQVWISLGDVLMDARRFGEAVDAYQKGLALDPKNVNARVDMGTCYRGLGKFDKAVEEYRKALKQDPNHLNGHRNLAVVLSYDLHNTAEGLKEFKRYLELAPNAPDSEAIKQSVRELSSGKTAGK